MESRLLWLAAAALAAGGIWLLTRPDGPASPDGAALSEGAAMVEVSEPAQLTDAQTLGKTAFEASCATCHGPAAAGRMGKGPPLVHKIYEPGHHGDGAFLMAARRGVRAHHWQFGDMPPVDGLTNSDIDNIVAYVRALQRENGIE